MVLGASVKDENVAEAFLNAQIPPNIRILHLLNMLCSSVRKKTSYDIIFYGMGIMLKEFIYG